MPKPRMKPFEPEIAEQPDRRMVVVHTEGDPSANGPDAMKALYGAAYALKFDLKKKGVAYSPTMPCGRWEYTPGSENLIDALHGAWGIQVPDGTTELPEKVPPLSATLETWEGGTVAQVLYVGDYSSETPTIEDLLAFADARGYDVIGPHEEEYWSGPTAKQPKTIIRYRVRKRV